MERKEKVVYIILIILSFFVPIVILCAAYYNIGVFIGGENTILAMDMQAQYMPFYASLNYLGSNDNSLYLNMSGALGNNYWGSFAYYLMSPLVWITMLLPLDELPDLIYVITLLKIGSCGVCFCLYLLQSKKDEQNKFYIFMLSCCYALMSYNIAYSINLMWLDGVMMLPIVLIGVDRMIRENNPCVLIVSTAISMILCYYISFMSALFVFFYLLIRCDEEGGINKKKLVGSIISALLGVGISMPVVLPGVMAMSQGKIIEEYADTQTQFIQYNPLDVLKQLTSGRYDTVYNNGLPFLFCGSITLFFVFFFFLDIEIRRRTKLLYGMLLAFYITAMCLSPLDKILHGFRDTACFEVRYSYVVSCLLLILSYKGSCYVTNKLRKYKVPTWTQYIVGVIIILELFMNSSIITSEMMVELHYSPQNEYNRVLKTKQSLLSYIEDDDFYRVSDNTGYTHNDGAWLGYNGIGYFSSCYNYKLMNYLGALGENQSYHDLRNGNRTRLIESVMGARYKLNYMMYDDVYEVIADRGLYNLLYNKEALSLGYMVDYKPNDLIAEISPDMFENQNNLAKELSGLNVDVFRPVTIENYSVLDEVGYTKAVEFDIYVVENEPIWLYFEWAKSDERNKHKLIKEVNNPFTSYSFNSKLLINNMDYGSFMDENSCFGVYLGKYTKTEKLHIKAMSTIYFGDVHAAYMDVDSYNEIISKLGKEQLRISDHKNGEFKGSISVKTGGYMLMTLPYMNGWSIKVDGSRVKPSSYRSVFLLIPLDKGIHSLDIKYYSPGIIGGSVIGVVSLLIVFAILKKHRMNSEKFRNRSSE